MRSSAIRIAWTRCCGSSFAEATPPESVAVLALGGYGRRHLCLHSDIDLLVLFGGRIGAAEERFLRAFLHPLWDLGVVVGHQVREIDDFRTARGRQPGVPAGAARRAPGGRRAGAVRSVQRAVSHAGDARAHSDVAAAADRGAARAFQRDALPARARRQGVARGAARPGGDAHDRAADRSAAAAPRSGRSGAVRRRRRFPAAVRSALHLETDRNQNVLSHELQERTADLLGYPGDGAAAARRATDERLLPPRAHRRALARMGAQDGAGAGGAEPRAVARRHPVPRSDSGGARSRRSWIAAFQAAIDAGTEVTEEALSCIQQHVDRYRADDFFPDDAVRAGAAAAAQAAARALRASVGDARLRSAWACVSGVPGDFVAGRARLLPQVHGRRAHAADDPQPRTPVGDDRSLPPAPPQRAQRAGRAGTARARAAAARRRQVARRRPRDRKRAHGRATWSIGCSSPARRARRCCS